MTDCESKISYRRAIEFLYTLRWFGAKPGLENTLKLAELAGNPQRQLRFIHVAGTNGKGSTCAMLESIYRSAGLRVGLSTSPHLVSFRERIQVNRELIAEAAVARLVDEMRPMLNAFSQEDHPTFFETVTVMALRYFAEQKCDLVMWETGLGGRLDATNIVTPLASVITNIQYDHQKWLGETLSSIAAEKAGIIKPGVPVITGADEPEALSVIEKTACDKQAMLIKAALPFGAVDSTGTTLLPLVGEHQRRNAAVALATVSALQKVIPVSQMAIQTGLATVQWPGRLQLITRRSGQQILLDGAHNVAGAEVLAATLKTHFARERRTLVLGILRDKDWPGICRILAPLASKILLVAVQNERTTKPEELAGSCKAANPGAHVVCCSSLAGALQEAAQDPFVVLSGSLYLVGEAMELLGLAVASANERGLNEWIASVKTH